MRLTPSWMRCSALDAASAWASVLATTNSTPVEPGGDHVVDGVAAGAADADHGDLRLQVGELGKLQLDAHRRPRVPRPARRARRASPRPRPAASKARACSHSPTRPRYPCGQVRRARGSRCAARVLTSLADVHAAASKQTRRRSRTPDSRQLGGSPEIDLRRRDAHRTAKRVGRELGQPDELARATRQHDTLAGVAATAHALQPLAQVMRRCLSTRGRMISASCAFVVRPRRPPPRPSTGRRMPRARPTER